MRTSPCLPSTHSLSTPKKFIGRYEVWKLEKMRIILNGLSHESEKNTGC
jgi:hypothetical protein